MQRQSSWLLVGLLVACGVLGGCVVAPPRARVVAVAVAPAPVWVPGHWVRGGYWIGGHWR